MHVDTVEPLGLPHQLAVNYLSNTCTAPQCSNVPPDTVRSGSRAEHRIMDAPNE